MEGILKRRRYGFIGMLAAATILAGQASDARAQSLEEAMISAYQNNPTLQAQRASLRATDEAVPQALSNWRPTIEATADYGRRALHTSEATGTNLRQHRDPRSFGVSIEQTIFRGFRSFAEASEAENDVKAARATLAATEQDVLLDVVEAYMNVVRDQAVVELNASNEQVLQRQLEATRDRFQVGEITRTDVHQAEARLARATADRIQAEGDLQASRAGFENVVGFPPETLTAPTAPVTMPDSREDAIKLALKGHPDIVAADYSERSAQDEVDGVRGELLPTIDVTGTADRNFDSVAETSRITSFQGTVSLTVPLYQSGSVYSRLREAKQTVSQERRDLEKARRDAAENAATSWESLMTAQARIKSFETQIRAAQIALDGVVREAGVGSRTVLDVLDAEQELLDAKVSAVRAKRDEIFAAYQLMESVGMLTARRLALGADYYNPEEHYDEVKWKFFGGSASGEVDDREEIDYNEQPPASPDAAAGETAAREDGGETAPPTEGEEEKPASGEKP